MHADLARIRHAGAHADPQPLQRGGRGQGPGMDRFPGLFQERVDRCGPGERKISADIRVVKPGLQDDHGPGRSGEHPGSPVDRDSRSGWGPERVLPQGPIQENLQANQAAGMSTEPGCEQGIH